MILKPHEYPVKWYNLDDSKLNNVSDLPEIKNEEYQGFCAAVGQAMLGWSRVETQVYFAYRINFKAYDHKSATAAWEAIDSFRGRLKMADYCIKTRSPEWIEGWDKLKERCRKRSLKRNFIAHSETWYDCKAQSGKRFFISNLRLEGFDKMLYQRELNDLFVSFDKLANDMIVFFSDKYSSRPKD